MIKIEKNKAIILIQALERNRMPPAALDGQFKAFTVGASKRIARSIFESIKQSRAHDVRIIIGEFGSGKSHTLRLLKELLEDDIHDDTPDTLGLETTAIMELNLSAVQSNAYELQKEMIKSLTVYSGEKNTLKRYDALRHVYQQLRKQHRRSVLERILNDENTRDVIREAIGAGVGIFYPVANPIYLLATGKYEEWRKERQVGTDIRQEIEELARHATAIQDGFIEAFIRNGKSKPSYIEQYDSLLAEISTSWEYMDVLLRILKVAGYKHVVILIDETEQVTSGYDPENNVIIERLADLGSQMLKQFHIFHQRMADAGIRYPAVIQVITIPEKSLKRIDNINKPLTNVWLNNFNRYSLNLVTKDTGEAKEIIKNIAEVMRIGGYYIDELSEAKINDIEDDIYVLLESEIDDVTKKPGLPATMRNVIPRVIRRLQKEVQSRQ